MTISSQVRIAGPYTGNGTTDTFSFSFKVFSASDLLVVKLDEATNTESTLALTTDYTVTLNGNQDANPGGSVTLVAGNLAAGFKLTVTSEIDYLQPVDLTNQGGFYPKVISNALDRLTIFVQQIVGLINRGMRFPISDGTIAGELPVKAVRAGKFLTFDEDGNPTVDGAISTYYYGALASDPATRPNGSAVNEGDYYFNTADKQMRVYNGTNWQNTNSGSITVQNFSGDGVETVFTLPSDPGTERNTQIYVSGVYQQKDQYTVVGMTLTFTAAPPLGTDNIEVVTLSVAEISTFTPGQLAVLNTLADDTTPFALTLLNDADAAAARTTLSVPSVAQMGAAVAPAASETVAGRAELATQAETDAGSDDSRIVTPKKLRWGVQMSLVDSAGYILLPTWLGGLMLQWGHFTFTGSGSGTASVTLPIAFPSEVFVAIPGDRSSSSAAGAISLRTDLSNRSALVFYTNDKSAVGVASYFAVGK